MADVERSTIIIERDELLEIAEEHGSIELIGEDDHKTSLIILKFLGVVAREGVHIPRVEMKLGGFGYRSSEDAIRGLLRNTAVTQGSRLTVKHSERSLSSLPIIATYDDYRHYR